MSDQTSTGQSPAATPATIESEEEEAKRRRRRTLLMLLALLLLLLCLGGTLYWWFGRKTEEAQPTPTTTTTTTVQPSPTATTPTATPTTPPPVQTFAVPSVVGKTAEEAEQLLHDAGFNKVTFVSGDNPADPVQILSEWKVVEQSPAAGEQVGGDTEIVITVTKLGGGKG